MSLVLTIGGTDFTARYQTGSLSITSQIQNQGDSCTLNLVIKTGQTLPRIGQEFILMDGSRYLFGGFVTKLTPTEYGVGQALVYALEAVDYTYILTNKMAQGSYVNKTLGYIVADLLSTTVAAGYGMTHTNTATGPVVPSVTFNHISLRKCFENLAKLTNFIWWVDYAKDVHFIDPSNAQPAPEKVTDSSANIESMAINGDATQVRNQIIIEGGVSESSNYQDVILGDGNGRGWVLTYGITTLLTIELDTGSGYVSKVFGLEGTDDETACYFMYSPQRGSIRMSSGSTTPAAGNKIRVTYTYPLPVLTVVSDAQSIALMQSIEGGDGIHSYTISDTTITTKEQAVDRGMQELAVFAYPVLQGEFFTRTGLLQAGSYFRPGQAITVNLPSWSINQDTVYVIQSVVTTTTEGSSGIEYHYDVKFGGRLIGVTDFLLALAETEEPPTPGASLQKIYSIAEVVHIQEIITRNNNVKNIAETITVSESLSKVNVTPPFRWAPEASTKKLRWGEGEWS